MTLVILVRSLFLGGAERQAVEVAYAMSERGHDVTILTLYSGGPLLDEAQRRGVNVANFGRRGWWDFPFFLMRLAKQLRKKQIDVLYSFGEVPNLAAVLVRPFIFSCRIAWGIRNNAALPAPIWFAKLVLPIMPRLSPFADLIIANSHDGKTEALRQGFNAANFYVVYNCINTQKFVPSDYLRERFRQQIGVAPGEVLIGTVGIRAGKGTEDIVRAVAMSLCENQNLKLLIVGVDASRLQTLSQLIDELGLHDKASCLNVGEDVVPVLNAIDILCSASYGEGFPNVIAEAMACGKPCVVTNVGESATIVGRHGVVVPPGEPTLLADGLLKMAKNLSRFGNQGTIRRRIVENFSAEVVAKRIEELFRSKTST